MRRQKSRANGKAARTAGGAARVRPGVRRASELMELATVAARARDLAEFLKLFSERVAGMLSAEWCGVVVIRGQNAELEGGTDCKAAGDGKNKIKTLLKKPPRKKRILMRGRG